MSQSRADYIAAMLAELPAWAVDSVALLRGRAARDAYLKKRSDERWRQREAKRKSPEGEGSTPRGKD